MSYNKENMYFAHTFDKIRINLEKEKQNASIELYKIMENDDYTIYTYKTDRYTYILGQSKDCLRKVYFLGKNYDHICIYKDNLFMCNHIGELTKKESLIHKINLKTKIDRSYDLRENRGKLIFFNGYGRYYSIDDYKKMEVKNDELIISCHRTKNTDKDAIDDEYNKDMDFELIFRYKDNDFIPYFKIKNKEFELITNNYISDEEIAKEKKKDKIIKKLDDFIAPFGFCMILLMTVSFIACLITKFSNVIWDITLIVSIVGLILDELLNRIVGYCRKNKE